MPDGTVMPVKFQSLVGRLETRGANRSLPGFSWFQSLVGRLETHFDRNFFQSFVGRLERFAEFLARGKGHKIFSFKGFWYPAECRRSPGFFPLLDIDDKFPAASTEYLSWQCCFAQPPRIAKRRACNSRQLPGYSTGRPPPCALSKSTLHHLFGRPLVRGECTCGLPIRKTAPSLRGCR